MRARTFGLVFAILLGVQSGCAAPVQEPCASGEKQITNSDGESVCAAVCSVSLSCPQGKPICDDSLGVCRPCSDGEDRRCRERGSEAGRCVGGRCVACVPPRGIPTEVTDCEARSPICDGNTCRPCQRHRECLSGVCAKDDSGASLGVKKGSCVPPDQVLIVDQELCSRTGPVYCTPQQAFTRISATQRYVLLRRGAIPEDFSSLSYGDLPIQAAQFVRIIGPLADNPPHRAPSVPQVVIGGLAGKNGLTVSHGRVLLEGFFVRGNRVGIGCTGSDADVQIVRSFFSGNGTAVSASGGCKLTVADSWIGSGPVGTGFMGLSGNARGMEVNGAAEFHIENTVFTDDGDFQQDALGGIHIRSLGAGTALSTVVNSTFYQQAGLLKAGKYITTLMCDSPVGERLVFMNSLFFGDQPLSESPEEHYFDKSCGARIEHVASNDAALTGNGSVVLPNAGSLFVNGKGRDLRPLSGSDEARLALASGGVAQVTIAGQVITAPGSDLDAQPREVSGDRSSIGAFSPVAAPSP